MIDQKPVITFKDYLKKFKNSKIGPLTFEIQSSKITALLGSSGSGKTVIINTLLGIIRKYKGDIVLNDINRKAYSYYKANYNVGFYTQMDFSLYEVTAYEFLLDICLMLGLYKKEYKKRIEYWMKYFDLWESKDKKIKNYSWGMKNRMNLILCFIKEPSIIILD
ncbi:ATP-binding cassette domain-containing protein [Spiroplasma floricola]|uniref:ABC transporter ATP-binding protein n=1 Tax=Spiroplasma floricola 23-6 TaxID=1336749 RepID=A0A2K8SDR6_9MOLU|nr:ATP-binding cassette domain-containing protein [Spiroplasma floricola]AUB31572.1 ABC transporter ATP-binding protein [Spiroplasma floricola 23-6]